MLNVKLEVKLRFHIQNLLLTLKPVIHCFRLEHHYQHGFFCSKGTVNKHKNEKQYFSTYGTTTILCKKDYTSTQPIFTCEYKTKIESVRVIKKRKYNLNKMYICKLNV